MYMGKVPMLRQRFVRRAAPELRSELLNQDTSPFNLLLMMAALVVAMAIPSVSRALGI